MTPKDRADALDLAILTTPPGRTSSVSPDDLARIDREAKRIRDLWRNE